LISARSRRKLGGATAITPFGSLAGSFPDLSRIMPGMVLKRNLQRNLELSVTTGISPLSTGRLLHAFAFHIRIERIRRLK
jgi:hypothetical protein